MNSTATIPNQNNQRVVRHAEYYIHGGDVIFRVSRSVLYTVLIVNDSPSTG
jgi:uncharacterized protein (UPF0303 family)